MESTKGPKIKTMRTMNINSTLLIIERRSRQHKFILTNKEFFVVHFFFFFNYVICISYIVYRIQIELQKNTRLNLNFFFFVYNAAMVFPSF